MKINLFNWYDKYVISQNQQKYEIVYRGTPKPETQPRARDFRGIYFSTSPLKGYGPYISKYKLLTNKMFIPTSTGNNINRINRDNLVLEFYNKYGYKVDSMHKKWRDMGSPQQDIPASYNMDDLTYVQNLSYLLLFPTQEWVTFLKEKGFDGFIVPDEGHVFVFDSNNVQYVGPYK